MQRVVDYELVAKRQRSLLIVVLVVLVSNLSPFILPMVLGRQGQIVSLGMMVIYLIALIAGLVISIRLMTAERKHPILIVLLCLGMFIPLINLFVLLHINSEATMLLRARGVKVGLLGAPKSEWPKLRAGHCRGCGYDRSGIEILAQCPECGRVPEVG